MCPDQTQAFTEVNNIKAFTVGMETKWLIFFPYAIRLQVLESMFAQVSREYSNNWLQDQC